MCPAQSRQSPAPCEPTCGPRDTGDEAATTALLLVAVGDVGLVPTSGPLTGLEMEMARTPCCCCCCPASAQMQLLSTQLDKMGHRLSGGDRWGEEWSKMNQGRVMIGMYFLLFVSYLITKNNLLKRYVSKYIYALQRYNIISLRMNIEYPHNIHCNCRPIDILFVILLSTCFGEVADVATWRYCNNVKSKSFNQKLDNITCNTVTVRYYGMGKGTCTYP